MYRGQWGTGGTGGNGITGTGGTEGIGGTGNIGATRGTRSTGYRDEVSLLHHADFHFQLNLFGSNFSHCNLSFTRKILENYKTTLDQLFLSLIQPREGLINLMKTKLVILCYGNQGIFHVDR